MSNPATTAAPADPFARAQQLATAVWPHAPLIASLLLAVLCGLAAARLTWQIVDLFQPPSASSSNAVAPTAPTVDLAMVADRLAGDEPFGALGVEAAPQGEAPDTRLNLQLRGVIAAGASPHSRAFIASGNGDEKGYAVGAQLPGGAVLHSVLPDRVVLRRGAAFETLRLPRESGGDAGPVPNAITTGEVRDAQQNPSRLLDWLRPVAATESSTGRLLGYRVYPGRDPDRFAKLGLLPGDLVTAVNGQTLDDPARSMEMLRGLSSSDSITLTVERDGAQRMVQVPIFQ
jgi:general secretion pathway protein C